VYGKRQLTEQDAKYQIYERPDVSYFFAITNRVPYEKKGYTFLQINMYLRLHSYSVQQTKPRSIARFGSLLDKTTVYREASERRGLMTSRHVSISYRKQYKGCSVDHHDLINNKSTN